MNTMRKFHKPMTWLLIIALVATVGAGLFQGLV